MSHHGKRFIAAKQSGRYCLFDRCVCPQPAHASSLHIAESGSLTMCCTAGGQQALGKMQESLKKLQAFSATPKRHATDAQTPVDGLSWGHAQGLDQVRQRLDSSFDRAATAAAGSSHAMDGSGRSGDNHQLTQPRQKLESLYRDIEMRRSSAQKAGPASSRANAERAQGRLAGAHSKHNPSVEQHRPRTSPEAGGRMSMADADPHRSFDEAMLGTRHRRHQHVRFEAREHTPPDEAPPGLEQPGQASRQQSIAQNSTDSPTRAILERHRHSQAKTSPQKLSRMHKEDVSSRGGNDRRSRSPLSVSPKRRPHALQVDVENMGGADAPESPALTPGRRALGDVTPSRNSQVKLMPLDLDIRMASMHSPLAHPFFLQQGRPYLSLMSPSSPS
jgi:hypothetical protein